MMPQRLGPLKWEQWFLAQCHRKDEVGPLARLWIEESRKGCVTDCEAWLNYLYNDPAWKGAISKAKNEYKISVECLARGKSSPTFRRLFACPEHEQVLKQSSAHHRQHSEVSPEDHLRQNHIRLYRALESRTLIYLDTNHWVNLRHVLLKSKQAQPPYRDILRLINDLALRKRLLCPVSFPLFIELMKQHDETTRIATARLIDCFSGGVCFQFPLEIERLELRQQILRSLLRDRAPGLKDQVWTKVGYIAGEMLPFVKSFSDEDLRYIQKLTIDAMWSIPLEHFAECQPKDLPTFPEEKLAEATNADAKWYRMAKLPFEQAFQREKAHLLRLLMKDMEQIAKEVWDQYPDHRDVSKLPTPSPKDASPWVLPSVQVLAGINAVLISTEKKFSANDMLDFRHAALAVPYCDALFCDAPMAHILRSRPLEFDKTYQTVVLSRPDEILNYLCHLDQTAECASQESSCDSVQRTHEV